MGGFEGGDEAGFWDNTRFEHSKAHLSNRVKIAPLLQIEQKVFKVSFVEDKSDKGIKVLDNALMYGVYKTILDYTLDQDIVEFFETHTILLEETLDIVPSAQTSLSNEIVFLHLIKDACSLVLTEDELEHIQNKLFKA